MSLASLPLEADAAGHSWCMQLCSDTILHCRPWQRTPEQYSARQLPWCPVAAPAASLQGAAQHKRTMSQTRTLKSGNWPMLVPLQSPALAVRQGSRLLTVPRSASRPSQSKQKAEPKGSLVTRVQRKLTRQPPRLPWMSERFTLDTHNIIVRLVAVPTLKSVRIQFETPVNRAADLAGHFGACAVHTKRNNESLEHY